MNRICELRKKRKISQQIFAEDLNVDRSTISKWETGESNPTMDKIIEISDYFKVSIDFLLGRESSPQSHQSAVGE